jgi:hypothetical protein
MTLDREKRRKAGSLFASQPTVKDRHTKESNMNELTRESLEGKSISELIPIHNELAKELGQSGQMTFRNAEAAIKAILGLKLTLDTPMTNGRGKNGKKPAKVAAGKAAGKKPAAGKAAGKKPVEKNEDRDEFNSRPGSLKEQLLAAVVAKTGKPVAVADLIKALYGKDAKGPSAIQGVIKGAEIAAAKIGASISRENGTLTFSRKK